MFTKTLVVIERRIDPLDTTPKYRTMIFDGPAPWDIPEIDSSLGDTVAGNRSGQFETEEEMVEVFAQAKEEITANRRFYLEQDVQQQLQQAIN